MTPEEHEHDELLDELFGSLKTRTSPRPAHKQELRERLLAALQEKQAAPQARPLIIRRYRFAWAAAAVVVLGLGVTLLIHAPSHEARASFSAVSQNIRDARTVRYRWHLQLPGRPAADVLVHMSSEGIVRTEDEKKVRVLNYMDRAFLVLNKETGQANLVKDALPQDAADEDVMARFRSLYVAEGMYIGQQAVDGRELSVFQVDQLDARLLILVDPKTDFPVRIEVRDTSIKRRLVEILDDFTWNADLPSSLFSTDVPEGYILWNQVEPPTEQNLIDLLRVCSRIGNGSFPPALDRLTVARMVRADVKSRMPATSVPAVGKLAIAVTDADYQGKVDMKACVRGLKFIETLPEGSWRYAGDGVKLGETKPVFLWRVPGEEDWHVIFGDLKQGRMKEDELPSAQGQSSGQSRR